MATDLIETPDRSLQHPDQAQHPTQAQHHKLYATNSTPTTDDRLMSYQHEYHASMKSAEMFWREKASNIAWYKAPNTVLDEDANHVARWFADGELNTAWLTLDYHVEHGRAEQTALIYDSPVTGVIQKFSYRELRDAVATFAGALQRRGLGKGDRVILYMPMVPQAVIAMLACARLGAIHSVVFGGFAAMELASRIDDATPKMIITASCGIEVERIIEYKPIVDAARQQAAHKVDVCVVLQRQQHTCMLNTENDIDWEDFIAGAEPADCVAVMATDPLYILYTSGTTGKPKGVVRDNGGHAVALHYSMKAIYDINPGDVFWAASDVGWVVGHSYIVYAPLLAGCTTVLYEGKPVNTPDAGAFWRVIEQHGVNAVFAAPTAFRAIRKEDPQGKLLERYNLSSLRTVFLAGERTDPPTWQWLEALLQKPIVDHWWQTETGWSIAANLMGIEVMPAKPGSATVPVPGFDVRVLDHQGRRQPAMTPGEIVIKLPLPPGCFPTIWNNHERYQKSYLEDYPGFYLTGDGGYFDEDGYLYVMGRTDDVINVAGHRLSTGEMEELIARHPAVAECAVFGVDDAIKGQVPVALVVLKTGITDHSSISDDIVQQMRRDKGAVTSLKTVLIARRLPKTRSGKILRKTLRQIGNGEAVVVPSTIDDPAILDEIAALMGVSR